jgi:hypothetical protein
VATATKGMICGVDRLVIFDGGGDGGGGGDAEVSGVHDAAVNEERLMAEEREGDVDPKDGTDEECEAKCASKVGIVEAGEVKDLGATPEGGVTGARRPDAYVCRMSTSACMTADGDVAEDDGVTKGRRELSQVC